MYKIINISLTRDCCLAIFRKLNKETKIFRVYEKLSIYRTNGIEWEEAETNWFLEEENSIKFHGNEIYLSLRRQTFGEMEFRVMDK